MSEWLITITAVTRIIRLRCTAATTSGLSANATDPRRFTSATTTRRRTFIPIGARAPQASEAQEFSTTEGTFGSCESAKECLEPGRIQKIFSWLNERFILWFMHFQHDVWYWYEKGEITCELLHKSPRWRRERMGIKSQRTHLAWRCGKAVLQSIQGKRGYENWNSLRRYCRHADLLQGRLLSGGRISRPQRNPRTVVPHRLFNCSKNRNGFVQHEARFCQPSRPMPSVDNETRRNTRAPRNSQATLPHNKLSRRVSLRDTRRDIEQLPKLLWLHGLSRAGLSPKSFSVTEPMAVCRASTQLKSFSCSSRKWSFEILKWSELIRYHSKEYLT